MAEDLTPQRDQLLGRMERVLANSGTVSTQDAATLLQQIQAAGNYLMVKPEDWQAAQATIQQQAAEIERLNAWAEDEQQKRHGAEDKLVAERSLAAYQEAVVDAAREASEYYQSIGGPWERLRLALAVLERS